LREMVHEIKNSDDIYIRRIMLNSVKRIALSKVYYTKENDYETRNRKKCNTGNTFSVANLVTREPRFQHSAVYRSTVCL